MAVVSPTVVIEGFLGASARPGGRHVSRYGNYGNPRTPPQQPQNSHGWVCTEPRILVVYWSLYPKGEQIPCSIDCIIHFQDPIPKRSSTKRSAVKQFRGSHWVGISLSSMCITLPSRCSQFSAKVELVLAMGIILLTAFTKSQQPHPSCYSSRTEKKKRHPDNPSETPVVSIIIGK